jgi:hypothetical protein
VIRLSLPLNFHRFNPMTTRSQIAPTGPEFSRMVYGTGRMLDEGSSIQEILWMPPAASQKYPFVFAQIP